ncbi:MAG: hypothetical protein MHPSP_003161, partial [Paramarteilia canceri]
MSSQPATLIDTILAGSLLPNSIDDALQTFGVEAASRLIVHEIVGVFSGYGIALDIRHLYLLSDYMTQSGTYCGLNRRGAAQLSHSPLHKMSFETCYDFLRASIVGAEREEILSPSASVALGQSIKMGSGI